MGDSWQRPAADQAVRIARAILDGSMPIYLGCKRLSGPLDRLGIHAEKPFATFLAIDSEIDSMPICPQERAMWNKQRLSEEDAKLAAWLPKIQEQVFDACHEIIRRFDIHN